MTPQNTVILVYDTLGRFSRRAVVPEAYASEQAAPSETAIQVDLPTEVAALTYYRDGVQFMPPRPSEFHEFNYETLEWVLNSDAAWASVRQQRNARLTACDWTQLPDVPVDDKVAWQAYRQELRDVTSQSNPLDIVWPVPPA